MAIVWFPRADGVRERVRTNCNPHHPSPNAWHVDDWRDHDVGMRRGRHRIRADYDDESDDRPVFDTTGECGFICDAEQFTVVRCGAARLSADVRATGWCANHIGQRRGRYHRNGRKWSGWNRWHNRTERLSVDWQRPECMDRTSRAERRAVDWAVPAALGCCNKGSATALPPNPES